MNFKEYQEQSSKTCNSGNAFIDRIDELQAHNIHMLFGLVTEAAEIREIGFQPHTSATAKVAYKEEYGDLLWYLSQFCKANELEFKAGTEDTSRALQILVGELVGLYKRHIVYGKMKYDGEVVGKEKVQEVVNEILDNVNIAINKLGLTFENIMIANVEKLQKVRYKSGKFTESEALERNTDAEQKVLKGNAPTAKK